MTNLYDLLNRAIDSQPDTPEARLAVYNHIRSLYERRREAIDPTLPEAEVLEEQARLMREQASLETVIARIEAERSGAPLPSGELLSFDRFAADETPASEADDGAQAAAAQAAATDAGRGRPRVAARREPREGASSRRGIAIAVIALVLAGIGGAAWWLRADAPPPAEEESVVVAEAQTEDDSKITDRVNGAPPDDEPAQQGDVTPAAEPAAQPLQQTTSGAGGQAEVIAQRAFLFELDDQNPEQPNITSGQVVWRLEGKGSRSAVLYTDVTLPEAGLSFSLVIRPNDDASLPASHTIEVTFINAADKPERVVRDMAIPQLRIDKEPRGVALVGLTIPVADNIFLVGLSNLPSDVDRNYNLLRERDWVDLPVRFADGGIGTITFAKGSVGRQIITDAIDSWR
ncbi:hypothetical protein ACUSIJ_06395 [Pseudochelatococcus sp. B33]